MFKKVRKVEFAFYIIAIAVFLLGAALVVCGYVARFGIDDSTGLTQLGINEKSWLAWVGTDFLTFINMGFLFVLIAVAIIVINLVVNANYFSRQKEREERRQVRKAKMETALYEDSSAISE